MDNSLYNSSHNNKHVLNCFKKVIRHPKRTVFIGRVIIFTIFSITLSLAYVCGIEFWHLKRVCELHFRGGREKHVLVGVRAPLIQLLPALPLSHLSETGTQRHFNPVLAHSNPSDGCIIAKYVRHKMPSQLGLHLRELWQNSSVTCQETLSNTISWRKPSGHSDDTSPHGAVSNTVNRPYLTC